LNRRRFVYAGLGAIVVTVGGLATYFATRPPRIIREIVKETITQTIERTRTVTGTPITVTRTVTGSPITIERTTTRTLTETVTETTVEVRTKTVTHEVERETAQPTVEVPGEVEEVGVQFYESGYRRVVSKPEGWFETGQDADILLSGIDFNYTGGPLLFNHPAGIATDGKHLLLADRNNNRVLIWNELPTGNVEPDLVLGQRDFFTNNPGRGLDQLNWPLSVATDGHRVLVADTENDRILIWNEFPRRNGQPADMVLQGSEELGIDVRGNIVWPWAVWTDGKRLIVTSTAAGQVLIWDDFPRRDNQPPDIILKLPEFGTPRSIGSDGQHLLIGDHNAFGRYRATFAWKSFPNRDDQEYDFLLLSSKSAGRGLLPIGDELGQVLWSDFTEDGRLIAFGAQIYIWNRFPESGDVPPDYIIGATSPVQRGYHYRGGDGSGVAVAGERIYLTLSNANKVVGFHSLPTRFEQEPDFAVGAPDIYTNTLETEFFITNPVPLTDGEHLYVLSDFDHKLYVWRGLPDESAAKPDLVYTLPAPVWDGAVKGDVLALAGGPTLFLWSKLPLNGEKPAIIHSLGSVEFKGLGGVAIDDKYFYLADVAENRLYVWEGIPEANSEPSFVVNLDQGGRLSSDGRHLVLTDTFNHRILVFEIARLAASPEDYRPAIVDRVGRNGGRYSRFNLPMGATVFKGSLFIADTSFNRVIAWRSIGDAIAGAENYVILGEESLADIQPEIGRNKLFWPAGLAFDGSFLWVGEFKFSGRLLRFSVR
jgi:hypothetical protein